MENLQSNSQQKRITWKSSYGYFGLASIGMLSFLITQDFATAVICLALSLVFEPFEGKPYKEWTNNQKALVFIQLGLSAFIVGIYLYQVVTA